MAEIKLYVVLTDITHDYERDCLKNLKIELCEKFGGFSVIKNVEGLWFNVIDKELITDNVEIWQIVTDDADIKYFWNLSEKLRRICKQSTQFFAIDGLPFYVSHGI